MTWPSFLPSEPESKILERRNERSRLTRSSWIGPVVDGGLAFFGFTAHDERWIGWSVLTSYNHEEAHMSRITALFVGIAALVVISTVAEAADGCGRGMYYNGRRCVPQDDEPGYGYRRDYERRDDRGPQFRLDLGGRRDEGRYSPPNPSFKTFNNCPPNYTVQDGLCKPYTGR